MLILPAIDIYDGRCVRLRQGDYDQKTVYSASPAEVAEQFVRAGFSTLHVVDLQGAKEQKIVNWDALVSILAIPGLEVQVGGGVRTGDDIHRLIDLGAQRIVVGSVAAKSPELVEYWIQQFGDQRITIGMDVKDGSVAISGWLEDSCRSPIIFILDLIQRGARRFVCTDISRDGMLGGVNMEFFINLKSAFPEITIIASGGISTLDDIHDLKNTNFSGIIVGKALYEGRLSMEELVKLNGAPC
jgi:phosphoribosylformimino-5-aminoimidazole carboxamide ribotide isomerase